MSGRFGLQIVFLALSFVVTSPPVSAQTLGIRPAIVDSSDQVEKRLKENQGRASTTLDGNGSALQISYFASEPVEIFMVPLDKNGGYVPTDFITFTLPKTDAGDAEIELTVSPGWKPTETTWLLNLLSKDESTEAGFTSMEFVRPTVGSTIQAAVSHFFVPEPYSPSSFHALRGYRVLGTSATLLAGIALLVLSAMTLFFARKNRAALLLIILLLGVGAYELRFGLDLLRMTQEHLTGYPKGAYDEAGSVYLVAHAIETASENQSKNSVYVCRDGTNFKEKLLRYFVYPVPVSAEDAAAADASFALIIDKLDWELTTSVDGTQSFQTVQCGALSRRGTLLSRFPDGSVLYSLSSDE